MRKMSKIILASALMLTSLSATIFTTTEENDNAVQHRVPEPWSIRKDVAVQHRVPEPWSVKNKFQA